ncbi:hypothetical protein KAS08_01870 [Candidatus Pacearchaeota archaeon]|nr:hypothetical protein [Candidatus Pacearchaeota archaeon]
MDYFKAGIQFAHGFHGYLRYSRIKVLAGRLNKNCYPSYCLESVNVEDVRVIREPICLSAFVLNPLKS